MIFKKLFIPLILITLLPVLVHAQEAVNLQGNWEFVSQTKNGVDTPIDGRQINILTDTHYAWARQATENSRKTLGNRSPE